jgi:hypothetical protein
MIIRNTLATLLATCLCATLVLAEGTVTHTVASKLGRIKRHTVAWASSTNEFATGTTDHINGVLRRIVIEHDASATPDDAYDVTLKDRHTTDVLAGLGGDVATNSYVDVCPAMQVISTGGTNEAPFVIDGTLSLVVTNAGAETEGTLTLYIEE